MKEENRFHQRVWKSSFRLPNTSYVEFACNGRFVSGISIWLLWSFIIKTTDNITAVSS